MVCKNLDDQVRSGQVVLQTVEENLMSSTWRVSGELSILQSNMVCHYHNLNKSTWNYQIVHHILPKYYKTFDSSL